MTYYVGQPVLSTMTPDNTYTQEDGPDVGKPVVRGIVTKVYEDGVYLDVRWENTARDYYTLKTEVRPEQEPKAEYYVGQPVLNVSSGYVQESGPDMGKPVVRGIVTEVYEDGWMSVWWENTGRALSIHEDEVKPLDN